MRTPAEPPAARSGPLHLGHERGVLGLFWPLEEVGHLYILRLRPARFPPDCFCKRSGRKQHASGSLTTPGGMPPDESPADGGTAKPATCAWVSANQWWTSDRQVRWMDTAWPGRAPPRARFARVLQISPLIDERRTAPDPMAAAPGPARAEPIGQREDITV